MRQARSNLLVVRRAKKRVPASRFSVRTLEEASRLEAEAHPLSARKLLENPAGIFLIISSVILIFGTVYNIGLFILFDENLVSMLTIADHVSTSVHVLFTLIAVALSLALFAVLALGAAYFLVMGVTIVVLYLGGDEQSAKVSGNGLAERQVSRFTDYALRAGKFLESTQLNEAFPFVLLATMNGLAYLAIYAFSFEGDRLGPVIMVLVIFGASAFTAYFSDWRGMLDWAPYSRLFGLLVLIYLLPFQLGVFHSIGGVDFALDPENTSRSYLVGKLNEEAHILKTTNNGVFYIVRSNGGGGTVRYETWRDIQNFQMKIEALAE